MNILLINHYAGSPEMGMEFRPYYFAREWIKQGHKVDIIAADYSHLRRVNPKVENDFDSSNVDGITYHWIKTNEYDGNGVQRSLTMAKFVSKLWMKAKWIVKNLEPDVVICSSTYPLDTYVGQRIRKVSKKKVMLIHEVHDMWPSTLYEVGGMSRKHPFVVAMQIGENSAYKHSDYVVSLLPNSEKYMKEHGLGENKFVCIPNGVILDEWENSASIADEHQQVFDKLKSENKFIVGYFGGHALSNALDILLDAAALIQDKGIHFVLVGNGVEKNHLIQKSLDMNLSNVTFLPPVPKAAVPDLCKNFDCIYMGGMDSPLYRFGLCLNKMFDTMASGKPGICAFGLKTYFTEFECGFDIKANSEAICETIDKIKNMSDDELKILQKNSHEICQNKFNYEVEAVKFIKLMEKGVQI